ncbi:MAG TPA: redoxin domain-containing protein, partial [Anaerolineales bacterium]|nr:redoxin domain-containing protein [Anaerolineales bacterium]
IAIILAGLAIGAGLGVLIFFGFGDVNSIPGIQILARQNESRPAPEVDAPAPDFELDTLSGEAVRLSDYRGKTVLLNFWATWCAPCRLEMPAMQSRFEEHKSDLAVLGINFDEPESDVQAFAQELGLTFTILLDPGGEVQKLYRIRGYPSTYFLDADGVVRIEHIGVMTEDQLDGYLSQLGVGG